MANHNYFKGIQGSLEDLLRTIRVESRTLKDNFKGLKRDYKRIEKENNELRRLNRRLSRPYRSLEKISIESNYDIKKPTKETITAEKAKGRDIDDILNDYPSLTETQKGSYKAHDTMGKYGIKLKKKISKDKPTKEEIIKAKQEGMDIKSFLDENYPHLSISSRASYVAHDTMGRYDGESEKIALTPIKLRRTKVYTSEQVKNLLNIETGALAWMTRQGQIKKLGNKGSIIYYKATDIDKIVKNK